MWTQKEFSVLFIPPKQRRESSIEEEASKEKRGDGQSSDEDVYATHLQNTYASHGQSGKILLHFPPLLEFLGAASEALKPKCKWQVSVEKCSN